MIKADILRQYGAEKKTYDKNETLFEEGTKAQFYFEIISGEIKMCNFNPDGKEFIQRIFSAGRCFGEPPLFGDFTYPAHAITLSTVEVWKLPKNNFIKLIKDHPEIHFKITSEIASRLYYKAIMAQEISHEEPQHRILRLLQYLKQDVYKIKGLYSYKVELTRQQLADLTGLRVETTIRAIKKLEKQGHIKIDERKIWV